MKDTAALRQKMLEIWDKIETGEVTAQEARVHIGIARTVLDTLKVEIAAAHLNITSIPPVSLSSKALRALPTRKAA
jgi:hypothetical protein